MSNLSQEEIDALLAGTAQEPSDAVQEIAPLPEAANLSGFEDPALVLREERSLYLTDQEADALGEIGNICMGTSATTMHTLLGRKVTITTPDVSVYRAENVLSPYKSPFLLVSVEYIEGIFGKNLLILQDYAAALITDLLMGGDGNIDKDNLELGELHLSAMSEIMNQMVGASATAMSNMMGSAVNISPPTATSVGVGENVGQFLDGTDMVIKISFDMEIEGLLKSKLMQLMTIETGKMLVDSLMHMGDAAPHTPSEPEPAPAPQPAPAAPAPSAPSAAAPAYSAPPAAKAAEAQPRRVTEVKPLSLQSFDETSTSAGEEVDLDLINDIPLQVTVELGKTKKNLSDILNFGHGSIIVLDKLAGELVDVIVGGKRIARGEVVIIDENYGVRITEIFKSGRAGAL